MPQPTPRTTPPAATAAASTTAPATDGHTIRTPEALPLPHERDQGAQTPEGSAGRPIDPRVEQAYEDLRQGQVDTDLRATPGLDAARRERMVKPPAR